MVVLITGASHTGKTLLAQKLMETYRYLCFSIDHLKMGLIRSGYAKLEPEEDEALEEYLWPILREMIKTVIENGQNLILEGCYIPFDWAKDFEERYREQIRFYCLVMSETYIKNHFDRIQQYASVAEKRLCDDWCTPENLLRENARFLRLARQHGAGYLLIDGEEYRVSVTL